MDGSDDEHVRRAHLVPLVSPGPARPLFGPAVTIAYLSARDYRPQAELGFGSLFYTASQTGRPGRCWCWPPALTPMPRTAAAPNCPGSTNHGLAGMLADGRLRDFVQLRRYRFATGCRGGATRG